MARRMRSIYLRDMEKTTIPNALGESVIRDFPNSTLHVATKLAENFGEPEFEAEAKYDMLVAVSKRVAELELQCYKIHWRFKAEKA